MTLQDGQVRSDFVETSTNLLYNRPYDRDLFESFCYDGCDATIPEVTSNDVASMIDQFFNATIESSTECADAIGGPVDIALTSGGFIHVVRHKPQPAPYFPQ
jgi:hypothetical protein